MLAEKMTKNYILRKVIHSQTTVSKEIKSY